MGAENRQMHGDSTGQIIDSSIASAAVFLLFLYYYCKINKYKTLKERLSLGQRLLGMLCILHVPCNKRPSTAILTAVNFTQMYCTRTV